MAWSDFFNQQTTTPSSTDDFNYQSEADKIKRKRALADYLKQQGMQGQQGQFIKNGDFIGYAGGNTLGTALMQGLMGLAANKQNENADADTKKLDSDSIAALQKQLEDTPKGEAIPKDEAGLDALIQAKDASNPMPDAQSQPVPQVSNAPAPAPVKSKAAQAIANIAALDPNGAAAQAKAAFDQHAQQPGGAPAPVKSKAAQAIANIAAMDPNGAAAQAKAAFDRQPRGVGMPQTAPAMPQIAPTSTASPMPAPVAPVAPVAAAQAPTAAPSAIGNAGNVSTPAMPQLMGRTEAQANATGETQAPTQAQQIAHWAKVARTGPEGQQIATAQMNQMFASKNGRFSTTVHADPVNGGFIQVVTDSATGQTQSSPLGSTGGAGKAPERMETADGVMERNRKTGEWEPAKTADGQPMITPQTREANNKIIEAKKTDLIGLGDVKASVDQLMKVTELIKKVGTGRWNEPINKIGAYFTDSTDYDNMMRIFKSTQLTAAAEFLKGQGSVSDAERRLLGESQFDPSASTQSNIDHANKLLEIFQRHAPLLEQSFNAKYGSGDASSPTTTAAPKTAWKPSWSK